MLGLDPTYASGYEVDHEEDDPDDAEDVGDIHRDTGNSAHAESSGDEGDYEEDDGKAKHGDLGFGVSIRSQNLKSCSFVTRPIQEMPSTVFVSSIEADAGKSLVSLGLVDLLLRRSPKIGYFRPIVGDADDPHLRLMLEHFRLQQTPRETYAFTAPEANHLLGTGQTDVLLDGIIRSFKPLAQRCDFVLIEGTDFAGESAAFEFDANAAIARNLGSAVLLV